MKFFLTWSDMDYESYDATFGSEANLLAFLNERAGNKDFRIIRIIKGSEIEVEPAEKVLVYRVKS